MSEMMDLDSGQIVIGQCPFTYKNRPLLICESLYSDFETEYAVLTFSSCLKLPRGKKESDRIKISILDQIKLGLKPSINSFLYIDKMEFVPYYDIEKVLSYEYIFNLKFIGR